MTEIRQKLNSVKFCADVCAPIMLFKSEVQCRFSKKKKIMTRTRVGKNARNAECFGQS